MSRNAIILVLIVCLIINEYDYFSRKLSIFGGDFHEIGLAGTTHCSSKILHMDLQTRSNHSKSIFLQSYMYVDFRKIKTLGV